MSVNKKVLPYLFLGVSCVSAVHSGELDDLTLIRSAHRDQLYLFVEDKAQEFLRDDRLNQEGEYAQEVRELLVSAMVERGAHEEALNQLQNMSQHSPKLTFYKARALYGAYIDKGALLPDGEQRPHELLASVRSFLNADDQVMADYISCEDRFELGQYEEILMPLKVIVNEKRHFRELENALFLYGRSLYHHPESRYSEALDVFKDCERKFPQSNMLSRYVFWQGECHFELNALPMAEKAFLKALDLCRDRSSKVDIYYNLGWLYVAMGRLSEGILNLERVIDEPLDYSGRYQGSTRYKLASIRLMQNDPKACLTVIGPVLSQAMVESEPSLLGTQAALLSAQASMMLKDWKAALEMLSLAQQSTSDEVRLEASRLLGKVYLELGDHDTAEGVLNALVLDEVPLDFRVDVQLQLADVYFLKGDIYRCQDIYRQLLAEKSKKLEPMLHYKLARVLMHSNPLVECVFKRDQLLALRQKKHVSETDFLMEKEQLETKLKQVMSRIWIMSKSGSSSLTKDVVLEVLETLASVKKQERLDQLLASYLDDHGKAPSDVGLESAYLTALVDDWVAALWDQKKMPSYKDILDLLGPLGKYYPTLQIMNISHHLDHIIGMGEESPYLALAHYEKSRLFSQQSLTGDAIESLYHAIDHTADPKQKSEYLLELARREITLAKGIEGDPKTRKYKIEKALAHLDQVAELQDRLPVMWIDLKFMGHQLLLDYDAAENTLRSFLEQVDDMKLVRRLEQQLISFYFNIGREIKSAQRRLLFAEKLEAQHVEEAQMQRYRAALSFLEAKSSHDEGFTWLKKVAASQPESEWTFRSALKCVDILHRRGEVSEAEALLQNLLKRWEKLPLALQLETQMTVARQAMLRSDVQKAAQAFEEVMNRADEYPAIKAKAMIELGKTLKDAEPLKASEVFLQYHYLFPQDSKSQVALLESCRLQAKVLKRWPESDRQQKVSELKRLAQKLKSEKDRRDLMRFIEDATL